MANPVRYAVVGEGYFGQAAVLPAFQHAENSELVAIVSGDPSKRTRLRKKYDLARAVDYDAYDELMASGEVDAVYIVLPNTMHKDYTIRAARAGVHVLVEKPMATSVVDCQEMIDACDAANVKLMVAYRLHFEEANLTAVEMARSGQLGDPRVMSSTFSMQVREGNIRTRAQLGGGPLWDLGVYCVNASRYLFRDEPIEVTAMAESHEDDERFAEVPEVVSALLRFPDHKLAMFTVSFGVVDTSMYDLIGTEARLRLEPAYDWNAALKLAVTNKDGKTTRRTFERRDQVAAELVYFSDCIATGRDPEPSGREGLADVRVIEALNASAAMGRAVELGEFVKLERPRIEQSHREPPHEMPELHHAEPPTQE